MQKNALYILGGLAGAGLLYILFSGKEQDITITTPPVGPVRDTEPSYESTPTQTPWEANSQFSASQLSGPIKII